MIVKLLGTAAGGGFPQWNCACPGCRFARTEAGQAHSRTQNGAAVSCDGQTWYLINAAPDISAQIEAEPSLQPGPAIRSSPIAGVMLTDAELDHTIGLLSLREGGTLNVYVTAPVADALTESFPIRPMLEPYAASRWHEMTPGEPFALFGGQLTVTPFVLGCKAPRYAYASSRNGDAASNSAWVIGLRLKDEATGGVVIYAPCVEAWTPELDSRLADADCILIDGTFWRADELTRLGISELDAHAMGHIPISGGGGSLERLAAFPAARKIWIHINNTNPIADPTSAEHSIVLNHGFEIGSDGMVLEV
ncbi:pyrroloquinoline quinone biosynthesis protein PqqB [Paenibacillus sp. DMB20]|uniref:pyrroloquinoline quinone biosynthesis protein PqqB n=1 Tax=Paenibacillus sp. DMB20 TaxID=1642570 RepID=UPI0006281734|nr:pyrroloquinoline quinone biosynthesis protein PqqB [Paenibacillus sp. DMB20]KKO51271.1 hypothetical protein XI25_27685 [Paenibacillus sp. DMB20]